MKSMYFLTVFVLSSLFVAPQPLAQPPSPPTPNFDRPAPPRVPSFGKSSQRREVDLAKILFYRMDTDKNGSLSLDEFRAALSPKSTNGKTPPRVPRSSPSPRKRGGSDQDQLFGPDKLLLF